MSDEIPSIDKELKEFASPGLYKQLSKGLHVERQPSTEPPDITFEKKESWGPGPWQDEPDELHWVDEATGLDCMILRGPMGNLNGYVGIPKEHPWHGLDYEHEQICENYPDVHGELTFAACALHDGFTYSRRIPERPDLWWFGFDCGHMNDLVPRTAATLTHLRGKTVDEWMKGGFGEEFMSSPIFEDTYKTIDYVKAECTNLAKQLAEVK